MAFVAFGRKKVSNPQLEGSKNPMPTEHKSYFQQQTPQAQGPGQNEIEAFKILEDMEMDNGALHTPGTTEHDNIEHFPRGTFCESPTLGDKAKQELLESDAAGGVPQLLEHNVALRRNFDDVSIYN